MSLIIQGGYSREDMPLADLVIVLGLVCAMFNSILYLRYRKHKYRAYAFGEGISNLLFPGEKGNSESVKLKKTLRELKDHAEALRKELNWERRERVPKGLWGSLKYWLARGANIHLMWFVLPVTIIIFGFVLRSYCWNAETVNKPIHVIIDNSNTIKQ